MMNTLLEAFLLLSFGHFLAVVAVYLNHRFVFHGKLGKLPLLKRAKRLHALHHAHAYTEDRNSYFEPLWFKVIFFTSLLLVSMLISTPFAFGLLSFAILYAYRHKRIHNQDTTSYFSLHHRHHHSVNPQTNFSGVYPSVDKIFGTISYKKS